MDDPLSRGLPFELADVWRRSVLQPKDADDSLFAPLHTSLPSLDTPETRRQDENDLFIPSLDQPQVNSHSLEPVDSEVASLPSEPLETGHHVQDDPAGVWHLDLELSAPPEQPRIRTWEAFDKKAVPNTERIVYLSEAGPATFDAALARQAGGSNGTLPQDVMLRALGNLALGRASVFFQWDGQKCSFKRTLEHVPISGFSGASCDSFIQRLMHYATLSRSLRSSCTGHTRSRHPRPCMVAFDGCVVGVLDAIEEHTTNQLPAARSLLQLQALIDPSYEVLAILERIAREIKATRSDDELISILSDRVHEIVSADSSFGKVVRLLLERTSLPWLEQLAMDCGLISNSATGQVAEPNGDLDGILDSSALATQARRAEMPGFISRRDQDMIQDAKASLKVLRKTLPRLAADTKAQELCWSALGKDGGDTAPATSGQTSHHGEVDLEPSPPDAINSAWADADAQHDYLANLDAQISSGPSQTSGDQTALHDAVLSYCTHPESTTDLSTSLTPSTHPLDRLRPALSRQTHHLNRTLLRHLFTNNLTHHLELQHAYHLLHSGEFVTRLSTALFSTETTQSATRHRGTVPTAQPMGLRLGARTTTWPPASSELRLTLADLLRETHRADFPSPAPEIPLSFSIRQLPDPEIERVLDASSLHALDFLRLRYVAPAPLDAVLTPDVMETYDAVFRHLLRLLRVLHVTTTLARECAARHDLPPINNNDDDDDRDLLQRRRQRFAHRAHAFTTALFAHTMDLGVAAPWRRFRAQLDAIRDDGSSAASLSSLRRLHAATLDRIRGRLFLRRRQEGLRRGLEGVLGAVLRGAAVDGGSGDDGKFEAEVKALLGLLRGVVDRPAKLRKRGMGDGFDDDDDDDDEMDALRLLLVRLDWNGFYSASAESSDDDERDAR